MKPEDMHDMMETMMSKMFSGTSAEERVEFCSRMMPKCLSKVFAGVSPKAKEKFFDFILKGLGIRFTSHDQFLARIVN